jgi:glycosyltransferase involved in cell wall biosynthesis
MKNRNLEFNKDLHDMIIRRLFWKLYQKVQYWKDKRLIEKSGLFDPFYYMENNPDIALSGMSPLQHFLLFGGREERSPSAHFDTQYYLDQYQDVKQQSIHPLIHYLQYGKKEGREVLHPTEEILISTPVDDNVRLIYESGYFNTAFYLNEYSDVRQSEMDPVEHYLIHGWQEGRSVGNKFDNFFYIENYPDVKASGICPLLHYLQFGKHEGRLPKPFSIDEEVCTLEADITSFQSSSSGVADLKIAIVCHVYFLELWHEMIGYIKNIPVDFDLYVTTVEQHADTIKKSVDHQLPLTNTIVEVMPNRGRDIAPFLFILRTYLPKYDLVCKIHTKKSGHHSDLKLWRKHLMDNLLGSSSVIQEILHNFNQSPDLGVVYPLTFPYISFRGWGVGWGAPPLGPLNRDYARTYFPELEKEFENENFCFTAGSMFWFRPQALALLTTAQVSLSDFPEEQGQIDGTLAHAIERLFLLCAHKSGYQYRTTFFPSKLIRWDQIKETLPEQFRTKILFITHDLYRAGAEIVLLHLINWLYQHTFIKATVIALKRGFYNGPLLAEYQNVSDVYLWEEWCEKYSESEAAQKIMESIGRVDLIYGNTVLSSRLYAYFTSFHIPIITHVHELEETIQGSSTAKDQLSLRYSSDRIIACSDPVKLNLQTNHGIDPQKISLIYEFVKPNQKGSDNLEAQRRDLQLPENKIIIWGCGTIQKRKGTDLFVETALKLKNSGIEDFLFCWIGDNFWQTESQSPFTWNFFEDLTIDNQYDEHILFIGAKENPKLYFAVGDIFYLTSREDPFPLVCLEAAECGLPIVCFEEAGGMPDFVSGDAGLVVPYLDTDAAAHAISLLIKDPKKRQTAGQCARKKLLQKHIDDIAVPQILKICQEVTGSAPLVSIIVPVYNQEQFLVKRMASILNQKFRDFEIIILDDCSQDGSYEIAQSYLDLPFVSLFRNESNSGSPFHQWHKGINLARGQFVWIAEGDDDAEVSFLDTLLHAFKDPNISIAYCASHVIDEFGSIAENFYVENGHYLNLGFGIERWYADYTGSGIEEILHSLAIRNTIPNVSSVLFRREALLKVDWNFIQEFRTAGDWLVYISVLKEADIFYSAKCLNYHRKHQSSVVSIHKIAPERTLPDYFNIHLHLVRSFDIDSVILELMIQSVTRDLRGIWPDLEDSLFYTLYNEFKIRAAYSDRRSCLNSA